MGYHWSANMHCMPTCVCDWLLLGDTLQHQIVDDPRTVEGIPRLAQGEFFMLPQNFGWVWCNFIIVKLLFGHLVCLRVIFLGETFTGFILVSNGSSEQVKDVVLKVILWFLLHKFFWPCAVYYFCLRVCH